MIYRTLIAASLLSCDALQLAVSPRVNAVAAQTQVSRAWVVAKGEAAPEEDFEEEMEVEMAPEPAPVAAPPGMVAVAPELWGDDKRADIRIEGGSTLKTFKMPDHAERVQYILTSPGGRPVKAKVELWIGPQRCVHELIYDCMDGFSFPLKATLGFKKLSPVLKISTDGSYEFPLECGVFVPSPDESKDIVDTTTDMFYTAPMKDRVQGGSTIDNKGGAIRTFNIDPSWEKTQVRRQSATPAPHLSHLITRHTTHLAHLISRLLPHTSYPLTRHAEHLSHFTT